MRMNVTAIKASRMVARGRERRHCSSAISRGWSDCLTRLRGATAPDLQLSAICLHLPKSATELHRAFPKLSPVQIHAFALACVLSGKALSFPVALSRAGASTVPAAPAPELPKPKPLPPARKGFLRAFLDKLL